jgi:hypothetical protein
MNTIQYLNKNEKYNIEYINCIKNEFLNYIRKNILEIRNINIIYKIRKIYCFYLNIFNNKEIYKEGTKKNENESKKNYIKFIKKHIMKKGEQNYYINYSNKIKNSDFL